MKRALINIFAIAILIMVVSCSTDEFILDSERNRTVEFIVRPTSFISYNVATKSTKAISETQLLLIEKSVKTAYFLVFDAAGDRVLFESLTVSNNSIPSKKLLSDGGVSKVTVCFIANVPYSYANSLDKLEYLSTKPLPLTYASSEETGYMGIPSLILDVNGNNNDDDAPTQCFPMFGMKSCSLTANIENNRIEVPLKRLFAKVNVSLNLDLSESGETGGTVQSTFRVKKYSLNNMPNKVRLSEGKITKEDGYEYIETVWDEDSFNQNIGVSCDYTINDDTNPLNGFEFQYYVPEYIILPDSEKVEANKNKTDEEKEEIKPTLLKDGSAPLTMLINGMYTSVYGDEIDMTYSIYLGENNFDNFSTIRNKAYKNNITIKGAADVDNRVEMKYAGFLVGFPHSVEIDSHFDVRPLRIKFTDDFLKGLDEGLYVHGTVKVEILKDKNRTDQTSWISLERPLLNQISTNSKYCATINGVPYPTKRKYFTTNLISELEGQVKSTGEDDPTAGSSISFRTDDDNALDGSIITWVYIDEYSAATTSAFNADAIRQDTLSITFTMDGSTEGVTKKKLIRQCAIYPIKFSNGVLRNYTYGIEMVEEYTKDYDTDDNSYYDQDIDEKFQNNPDGIKWGLDGIGLSRNKPALTNVENIESSTTSNTSSKLKAELNKTHTYRIPIIGTTISFNIMQIFSSAAQTQLNDNLTTLDSYYDFYTSDDQEYASNVGIQDTRDYDGFYMNIEIIHTLLQNYGNVPDAKLNGIVLDENPLSAIAYCYNKNKRNDKGEVISINNDGSLDISNYHWYAPAIEEIEEIMKVSYQNNKWINENFSTFGDKMYWSCQPAYHLNDFELEYKINSTWTIKGRDKTETHKAEIETTANGNYLNDNTSRARATKYVIEKINDNIEDNETIKSFSSHISNNLRIVGKFPTEHSYSSGTGWSSASSVFSTYLIPYLYSLYEYIGNPNWSSGINSTGNDISAPVRGEGNKLRSETNRVRCVYYPHNNTKATREKVSGINSLYKDGYEYNLSK